MFYFHFFDSELFQKLEKSISVVNASLKSDDFMNDLSIDEEESLVELESVLRKVDNKLRYGDHSLFPNSLVSSLTESVNMILNLIQVEKNKIPNFRSINLEIENLIEHASNIPIDAKKEVQMTFKNFKDLNEKFQNEFDRNLITFRKEVNQIHKTAIKEQEDRSARFEKQRNEFMENYQHALENAQNKINQQTNETVSEIEKNNDIYKSKTEEFFVDLDLKKKKVENMIGILADNTIASNYKKVANTHWKLTIIWQSLTVMALIATVIAAGYGMIYLESDNWYQLFGKIFVTGALGALAAYTARQAKHNVTAEQRNRILEVELITLDSYMEKFDDALQVELKKELFPLIFGKSESTVINNSKNNKEDAS